jgi:hypothetical protein
LQPAGLMERAFEIARSGKCRTVREVRNALKKEQYSMCEIEAHLSGTLTKRQLKALIAAGTQSILGQAPVGEASPA